MANIDGMTLCHDSEGCGGAFRLSQPSRRSWLEPLDRNSYGQVKKGSSYLVAQSDEAAPIELALDQATETAQKALDLIAFRTWDRLAMEGAEDTSISWGTSDEGRAIRMRCTLNCGAEATAGGAIRLPDGETEILPRPGKVDWHPTLRYLRASQVAVDIMDSYRNLYLAFEAALSAFTPKNRGEREGEWVKRGLREIADEGIIDLDSLMHVEADGWLRAHQELYRDRRNMIFHAKEGNGRMIPWENRQQSDLRANLQQLGAIVARLCPYVVGQPPPVGGLTEYGSRASTKWFDSCTLQVSDDATPPDESIASISPAGRPIVSLETCPAAEQDEPMTRCVLGRVPTSVLGDLTCVRRVVCSSDGRPWGVFVLDCELCPSGFDVLEVLWVMRYQNLQMPRGVFQR